MDGTSLTVNAVNGNRFELNIVPYTLQETIMNDYAPGCRVNLEVDLLARYLERLLLGDKAARPNASAGRPGDAAAHRVQKNLRPSGRAPGVHSARCRGALISRSAQYSPASMTSAAR